MVDAVRIVVPTEGVAVMTHIREFVYVETVQTSRSVEPENLSGHPGVLSWRLWVTREYKEE